MYLDDMNDGTQPDTGAPMPADNAPAGQDDAVAAPAADDSDSNSEGAVA